jgi:hypothetical protein
MAQFIPQIVATMVGTDAAMGTNLLQESVDTTYSILGKDVGGENAGTETGPMDTGEITTTEDVEAQAAQRRLARLSKYFTSPLGILDNATTGSQRVFS